METILYSLLSLVPAVLNIGILVYLFFFVPREKTTDVFSFFVLALVLWQSEDTIMRLCSSEATALCWDRLLCMGWAGMAPTAFHFTCRYTSLKAFTSRFGLFCIYVPAVLFYLLYVANPQPTHLVHQQGWGWTLLLREGTLDGLHRSVISLYITGALFLLFRYAFSIQHNRRKKLQAFLIATGMFIPTVQGIVTQLVFPYVLHRPDIPVTSSFMTLFSVATILSMRRYSLFNISDSINVETVLANLKSIVLVISPKRQIVYMNPCAKKVFGQAKVGEKAVPVNAIFSSRSHYDAFIADVFLPSLKRQPVNHYAAVFQTVFGTQMDVLLSTECITSNHQVQGLLMVASDVTELSKTLRDLEASNKELERFAYVASHDLQEPLRKVGYFLQLIELKYKDRIDELANTYINAAVGAAGQMRQLIQDLLAYSYLPSQNESSDAVNMNAVVNKVVKTLALQIEEADAHVTAEPLPVLPFSSETQMLQLVQNLISNSLKYRGDRRPLIRIWAEDEGDRWRFGVSDNGIGIATQHHEKVFAVFQRLHSKSQYPGTGIGLAICRKIVEQHGGRIWINSNPACGCTFFFTLPKQQRVDRMVSALMVGELVQN